jgi:preprotein translocase subunit SecG
MEIVSTVLTVVYVTCCLFLGFVVLIQKGEGGGLGGAFGGGAVDVAFGAKADMTWKRATAVAATLFMVLAVVLGILDQQIHNKSLAEDTGGSTAPETPGDEGGASSVGGATPGNGDKPADDTPADETPADDKPADETPVDDKPADDK